MPSGPISLVARGAEGNAGDIKITTGSLSVTNGAKLQAAIGGQGDVGSITIDARETVSFDGAGSGAFSEVEATGIGNVGNINITTGSLSMMDGAQLKAFTAGQGDAGSVMIDAVEAQGWVFGSNGEVILTANAPTVTPHRSWQTPAFCNTQ